MVLRRAAVAAVAVLSTLVLAAGLAGAPAAGATPAFDHLDPGGQPTLTERVPVNVVLLGYTPRQVSAAGLERGLARRYEPIVRSRAWYGTTEKLGITYTYDYRTSFAPRSYQDRFFAELARLARPAPLTEYQQAYNDQRTNVLDITSNTVIDAPSVERWLANNAPAGVDTRRNTVFLVNWYGRADFRHHVYEKTGEADPDTGYDFGVERESRKLIGWGGTTADDEETGLGSTRRVWFHDLSAGPESWTENWNVDDADLDGDGEPDYRMPPTWEYRRGGNRSPSALTGDLSKIVRYVALDLLMTTSPIYPVEAPSNTLPRTVNLDVNTYEGQPGVDASRRYLRPGYLLDELSDLRTQERLSYDGQDLGFSGQARRCYLQQLKGVSCYPELGFPAYGNLFVHNAVNLRRTQDDRGTVDYEMPIFAYSVPRGVAIPALGYADDDYRTGTQSFVFGFVSPEVVEAGYGLTTTLIHEVGHHVGLSHPHDGYDSETGAQFGPAGPTFFAWAGDESNSIMSYIDLNWDFGQFDRDNMDRFLAAAGVEGANRLAALALGAPKPDAATALLRRADDLVGDTEAAFAAHDYIAGKVAARRAYDTAVAAASAAGADPAAAEAKVLADLRAAPEAATVHEDEGDAFIDPPVTEGPRAQP